MRRFPIHTNIAIILGLSLTLVLSWLLNSRLPTTRAAGSWYVSTTGNDSNDCLSWAMACRNIQTAVTKATIDDTIYITTGTVLPNTI